MPILFACPHCGAKTNVPDEYAGRSGPCASCGKPITIPHGVGGFPGAAPPRPGLGGGGIIAMVVVGILVFTLLCGGVLVALLLPAVQAAREAARRSQCSNNLKQIMLALHNYHDTYKELPPAYFTDENGKPTHSWRVMILPFLDSSPVYSQYRFDEPWDSPHNSTLASQMPSVFRCPSDGTSAPGMANYMAISGPGAAWNGAQSMNFGNFTDGTSNTIMIVEVASSQTNWMEPKDLDFATVPRTINAQKSNTCICSDHPGGVQVGFADGSVRFLANSIDPQTLQSLMTASGGEPVPGNY